MVICSCPVLSPRTRPGDTIHGLFFNRSDQGALQCSCRQLGALKCGDDKHRVELEAIPLDARKKEIERISSEYWFGTPYIFAVIMNFAWLLRCRARAIFCPPREPNFDRGLDIPPPKNAMYPHTNFLHHFQTQRERERT